MDKNIAMFRRRRIRSLREKTKEDAQKLIAHEMFSDLGKMLFSYLRSTDHYSVETDTALPVAQWFLDRFPSANTSQLEFDIELIQQLLDAVVGSDGKVTRTVIPSYNSASAWGYEKRGLPFDNAYYLMSFIYFPRLEEDAPQLDDYVWLLHEVFHHVWSYIKKRFEQLYQPIFEAALFDNDLMSLADRSIAKQKSIALKQQFASVWQLGDTDGWPLELTVDTLCLYVSGPAYLDAFVEAHITFDPFKIERTHPPVELRASALLEGAIRLGWSSHTSKLERLLETWRNGGQEASVHNRYVALRSKHLTTTCVNSALTLAVDIGLPRLMFGDLRRLENAVAAGEVLGGLDLVVAARLYTRSLDETELLAWEDRAVKQLIGDDETT